MSDQTPLSPYLGIPRWEIDVPAMQAALDVVASFPPGAMVYFSLELVTIGESSAVAVYATNRDYVFESTVPVSNQDSLFDPKRRVFVKFSLLHSLVKLYPDFIFKFDEKGNLYYHNEFVTYQIKPLALDNLELPFPDYSTLESQAFPVSKPALVSAKKMVDFAVRIADNKVQWSQDRLSGQFITYAFSFQLEGKTKDPVQFRKYDMLLMSLIAAKDSEYALDKAKTRFFLFSGSSSLSFLLLSGKTDVKPILHKEKYGQAELSIKHLQKVLGFLKNDATATNLVFVPTKTKDIRVRLDIQSFFFVGTGEIPAYGFSLRLEELRRVLGVLPEGTSTAAINVYGDGAEFSVEDGGVKYSYILGKMDTTQTTAVSTEVIDRLKTSRDKEASR